MIDYIKVCDICEEPFDISDKTVKNCYVRVSTCLKDLPDKILGETRNFDIGDICERCRKELEKRITFEFAVMEKPSDKGATLSNGKIKHINQEKSF